jgi:N4-(beta-N-acetylglucosaminyl)-L-asparaginase
MDRRSFIRTTALAGASGAILSTASLAIPGSGNAGKGPIVISTWDFKLPVNQTAARVLEQGGNPLDAVEQAIRLVEEDPRITSVGRGGYPDRDGHLTLDACIMDQNGNAGSVVFLEHIMHPISVARQVMEKTPHVVLAGDGALQFAVEQGFPKEDLLTDQAREAWQNWLKSGTYHPPVDAKNHDTIGLLVMDKEGNCAGGCSTSGTSWKMHGRVGDSPLIGAGLYVDNEVGAATATGVGESVIRIAGTFLVVEFMRNGKSPLEACQLALERLIRKQPQYKNGADFLAGFIAINKDGEVGGMSYRKGLQYSLYRDGVNSVVNAESFIR